VQEEVIFFSFPPEVFRFFLSRTHRRLDFLFLLSPPHKKHLPFLFLPPTSSLQPPLWSLPSLFPDFREVPPPPYQQRRLFCLVSSRELHVNFLTPPPGWIWFKRTPSLVYREGCLLPFECVFSPPLHHINLHFRPLCG